MSQVALITGGSRGIGLALVRAFKDAGWKVATCATRLENLAKSGADHAFACDVSDAAQVRNGVAGALRKLGRLDTVVNNAGLAGSNPLDPDASDELWHRILGVNLHGTYHVCKQAMPQLPDRTGRIVNIASVLALKGVPDAWAYCAAKHGVLGLTRSLAHTLAPRGITVNAICPGWVRTEMARDRMTELGLTDAKLERNVPLGRFIEPEEVAKLALYLASEAAAGITGQALTIDGGTLA